MLEVVGIPQHPFSLIGIVSDLYLQKEKREKKAFLKMLQRPEKPKGRYDQYVHKNVKLPQGKG